MAVLLVLTGNRSSIALTNLASISGTLQENMDEKNKGRREKKEGKKENVPRVLVSPLLGGLPSPQILLVEGTGAGHQ